VRETCENCRTVYERSSAESFCPYCEHVNRERLRADMTQPLNVPQERDPLRTMTLGPQFFDAVRGRSPSGASRAAADLARMDVTVIEEGKAPESYPFTGQRLVIGRGDCDVTVEDPEVSRAHCAIELVDGMHILRDLKSTNGTSLNGQVIEEQAIRDGDEVRIGTTLVRFHIAGSRQAATAREGK
jgi:hypothetical protein